MKNVYTRVKALILLLTLITFFSAESTFAYVEDSTSLPSGSRARSNFGTMGTNSENLVKIFGTDVGHSDISFTKLYCGLLLFLS